MRRRVLVAPLGLRYGLTSWINLRVRIGRCLLASNVTKNSKANQIWFMTALDAVARPTCAIGALVWAYVLDKSACPNWAVPTGTKRNKKQKTKQTKYD